MDQISGDEAPIPRQMSTCRTRSPHIPAAVFGRKYMKMLKTAMKRRHAMKVFLFPIFSDRGTARVTPTICEISPMVRNTAQVTRAPVPRMFEK